MPELEWGFYVDLDGDGYFSNPAADIGADVVEWSIQLGFTQPFGYIAMPERVSVTLNNRDGRYSPEHASALAGLARGHLLHITASDGISTERTMALTAIGAIKPEPGQYDGMHTKLENESWLERARKRETPVEIQANERAGALVEAAVDAFGLYPPANLVSPGSWGALDSGTNVFPFAFDAGRGDLYSRLRDIAMSEGYPARVFLNRDGKLEMWDQAHFVTTTPEAVLDDSMYDLDYGYGDMLINQVTIRVTPRTYEDSGPYTLATMPGTLKVKSGQTEVVTLKYSGPDGARISTLDPIDPVAGVDWSANRNEDGSGADVTADFTVTATHTAQSSIWEIENGGARNGWIQAGATQRANDRLTSFEPVEIYREDAASIDSFGEYPYSLTMPFQNRPDQASALAGLLLDRFANPVGNVKSVSFYPHRNGTLLGYALNCTMGTRVTVTETKTGHSADYIIVGERHALKKSGTEYRCTWYLEPEGGFLEFWLIGVPGRSEIGVTTRIGL